LQSIVANLQDIIRSEFRLAKAEISEKSAQATKPATGFAVGAAMSLYGAGFLLLAAVYGLSTVMAMWAAALLVGAILLFVSVFVITSSRNQLKKISAKPAKTICSLEETPRSKLLIK
jgi:hypothetical protein